MNRKQQNVIVPKLLNETRVLLITIHFINTGLNLGQLAKADNSCLYADKIQENRMNNKKQ